MNIDKYLITEVVKMDSTEKSEWGKLGKWAKSKGFKNYKNGKQNPYWSDERGIEYIDGWALDKNSGFAIYTEEGSDSIYISWYAGGGPSGNDSLTSGYAKDLAKEFKENDDRVS